ncbi:hypothetical protein B0H34DRAFT_196492 [Crassisporium funariophilum]|nr:hypothetical protein B0H34DRAFT_196492 [Crassisporium funariophilum]
MIQTISLFNLIIFHWALTDRITLRIHGSASSSFFNDKRAGHLSTSTFSILQHCLHPPISPCALQWCMSTMLVRPFICGSPFRFPVATAHSPPYLATTALDIATILHHGLPRPPLTADP